MDGPGRGGFRGRGGPGGLMRGRGGFGDRGRGGPPRGSGMMRGGRGNGPGGGMRGPPMRGRGGPPGRGGRGGHFPGGHPDAGMSSGHGGGPPPLGLGPRGGSRGGGSNNFRNRGRADFVRGDSRNSNSSFRGRGGMDRGGRGGSRGGSGRGGPGGRGGFSDRSGGRGMSGGRGGPTKRGGPPSSSGPSKRPRFDQPSSQPSNGYATQSSSQGGYGSNSAYQQPSQQQSVGYGGGYGSQQGYTQSYQGYESYQQPPDYAQSTGYPSVPDSRYGGAPAVPSGGGFSTSDPYSYGKAPSANYQQGAVSAVGPGGGGANYAPVNPYDDRSSNANIIHRSYSTQPYDYPGQDGVYGKQDYGGSAGYQNAQSQRRY